jgi:hypothetical protein
VALPARPPWPGSARWVLGRSGWRRWLGESPSRR